MLGTVITRKGQVTIPKAVRDQVDLQVGDRVHFVVRDGEVVLKVLRGTILDLEGSVGPKSRPEDFDEIRRAVQRRRAERIATGV